MGIYLSNKHLLNDSVPGDAQPSRMVSAFTGVRVVFEGIPWDRLATQLLVIFVVHNIWYWAVLLRLAW